MNLELINRYFDGHFEVKDGTVQNGEVHNGVLFSKKTKKEIVIKNGVPRLCGPENYTGNFGLQWNLFRKTQLDSHVGLPITERRFFEGTKWKPEEINGAFILEAGSGAGRFTEILLKYKSKLVSFDYSSAVEANYKNNYRDGNFLLFQGDIYNIPFPENHFEKVFCYGVLQHLPDPLEGLKALYRVLKPGGKMSIDYYLKPDHPTVWATPKYFWRKRTAKADPAKLFKRVRLYVPLWLPFDTFIKKLFGSYGYRLLANIPVPCYNYLDLGLTYSQRKEWAILDTFDALGARYDTPLNMDEIRNMIGSAGIHKYECRYGGNGLIVNIEK